MGYLDYAGLQYLWGKLKEKFAPKSHSHDDRYYTESEMDGKLNSKVNNNEAGANGLINKLSTADGVPNDATVFISQHNDGKTPSYYRRPISTLWTYIKSKADSVYQPKGSYAASGHIHDDRYYTEAEINNKLDGKSNTGHTHDDRYYTETEIDTKLNGKAPNGHTHQYLSLYGARPANINFTKSTNGTGAMFHFVATSSTTTGKPPADSSILQLNWDNNGGWDSQLALSTTANPHVYYRNQQNGTWSNWSTLLDNLNYTDYAAKKEHTHSFDSITGKPSAYTPSAHNQSWSTITDKPALMESGDYSAETIEALLKKVQGLSPRMGSCCFTKDTHIANTWWNFIYTPHRTGSGGDNPDYGTLLLFPMVGEGSSYIVRAGKDGIVSDIRKIYTSGDKPNKGDVGLGNVDNTADANKSVKYATSAGNASTATKATTADSATTSNGVKDYNDANRTIKIGFAGSGLNTSNLTHIAGYTENGTKIKDVSKDVLTSWIGLGNYLPLSGGTMSGNITFSDIGNTNTSNKISWNGSTDGADIYYQTTAADQGNLVINLHDDSNCYLRIAKNGVFKSYFSPDDGNFHGNVNGTADVANVANFAKETYISQYKTVNLTDLDQNTWYPVTGTSVPYNGLRNFKCNVQLNSGSKPNWSTHGSGFTAVVDILEESSGWGTTGTLGEVLINDQRFIADESKPPVGYQQMEYGSIPVWWLRGGGSYRLATDYDCTWTIRKSTYTNSGQSVSPTTTYPGVNVWRSTITANLNGHATTAEVATVGVRDYNNANRTIRIGYAGVGLNTSNLTHIAGYTENGTQIKDVSKDVLTSWIGLGNYLPLSGGTMSGQITKSTGGSWIGDRDRAAIKSSYAGDGDYGAVAGMPTKSGFWTMGALGGWEDLVFNYSTDSNYSASKNETSQVRLPAQAGTIITSATIGSQSVNYANSAGNGVETSGADYIRFSNGLQICWGDESSGSSSGVNVFFPVPFSATPPYIGFGSIIATQFTPYLKSRSNTFFTWYKEGTTFGKVCWVAIGKWK